MTRSAATLRSPRPKAGDGPVVVHLFGTLDAGGAEMRILEVLRRQPQRQRHIMIALSGRAGALDKEFESLGHWVVHRPLSPTFPVWFTLFLWRTHATHVHSHVHLASGFLLLPAVIARVPRRIAYLHSTGDGKSGGWRRRMYRAIGRQLVGYAATDVAAAGQSVAESVMKTTHRRLGRSEVSVVYLPVDGCRFRVAPLPSNELVGPKLIAVGRLDREKNPQRAITVLAELRSRRPGATLTFVGRSTDAERRQIEHLASELGVSGAVVLLGQRDDVPYLLARSDLLLSTTLREGLPGVIVEAAAAGIPAVVSDIAPNEEVALVLPSVVPVPLAASDEAWCDVIGDVLDARVDRLAPRVVRDGFDRSPFAMTGAAGGVESLWT